MLSTEIKVLKRWWWWWWWWWWWRLYYCIREFESFELCRYAPAVRVCHPRGDGISSIANLLDIVVLRVFIWLVALVTCSGNVFVMVCRLLCREEKNVHSLFIKNLAGYNMLSISLCHYYYVRLHCTWDNLFAKKIAKRFNIISVFNSSLKRTVNNFSRWNKFQNSSMPV